MIATLQIIKTWCVFPDNPNDYPVYPEDDGYDRPRNPYSPV